MLGSKIVALKKRDGFEAKNSIVSTPAVYESTRSTLIVVSTHDGQVIAFDSQLKKLWSYTVRTELSKEEEFFFDEEKANMVTESPRLADINNDGYPEVIFGATNGLLYALDSRGKELWKFKCGDSVKATPLVADIDSDGRMEIVFPSRDGVVHFLDSGGRELRSFKADSKIECSPELLRRRSDTCIVFGSDDGTFYAVSSLAQEIWRHDASSRIRAQPAVGNLFGDGKPHVVFGTEKGALIVLTAHGSRVWSYKAEGAILAKPCLADINKDGRLEVLFGSCDDSLYALSSSGSRLWRFHTNFWIGSTPLVIDLERNPKILVGSYDGVLYLLDAAGSLHLNYLPGMSGFLQQAGHYTDLLTGDVGSYEGKEICSLKLGSMITGTTSVKSMFVVSTKDGVNEVVLA
jgi:outer membrane protein assembly factor BamB